MTDDIATSPESSVAPGVSTIGSEDFHEFIRYGFASAIALFFDAGLLLLLTEYFGLSYLLSGALAFTAGLIVVYFLSVFWVFQKRIVKSTTAEFAIFALIGLVGLGFTEAVLYVLTSLFGIYYLVSKIASVIVVFTWNFAARKWILFRTETS